MISASPVSTTSSCIRSMIRSTLADSSAQMAISICSGSLRSRIGTNSRPWRLASCANSRIRPAGIEKNFSGLPSRSNLVRLVFPRVFFWSRSTAATKTAKFLAAVPERRSANSVPSNVYRTTWSAGSEPKFIWRLLFCGQCARGHPGVRGAPAPQSCLRRAPATGCARCPTA